MTSLTPPAGFQIGRDQHPQGTHQERAEHAQRDVDDGGQALDGTQQSRRQSSAVDTSLQAHIEQARFEGYGSADTHDDIGDCPPQGGKDLQGAGKSAQHQLPIGRNGILSHGDNENTADHKADQKRHYQAQQRLDPLLIHCFLRLLSAECPPSADRLHCGRQDLPGSLFR